MTIPEIQKEIIADFTHFATWEERYKRIIELGKALEPIPEVYKIEKNLVRGCQSQVWLHAQLDEHGHMLLQGDSDAMIVRGLISMLLKVYSGQTPDDVIAHPPDFLQQLGFDQKLSPSRANGLFSMVKQIRLYAAAFHMMLRSGVE